MKDVQACTALHAVKFISDFQAVGPHQAPRARELPPNDVAKRHLRAKDRAKLRLHNAIFPKSRENRGPGKSRGKPSVEYVPFQEQVREHLIRDSINADSAFVSRQKTSLNCKERYKGPGPFRSRRSISHVLPFSAAELRKGRDTVCACNPMPCSSPDFLHNMLDCSDRKPPSLGKKRLLQRPANTIVRQDSEAAKGHFSPWFNNFGVVSGPSKRFMQVEELELPQLRILFLNARELSCAELIEDLHASDLTSSTSSTSCQSNFQPYVSGVVGTKRNGHEELRLGPDAKERKGWSSRLPSGIVEISHRTLKNSFVSNQEQRNLDDFDLATILSVTTMSLSEASDSDILSSCTLGGTPDRGVSVPTSYAPLSLLHSTKYST